MRLRTRALVALGLCLSMIGLGATPAQADYDSERRRSGVTTWGTAPYGTGVKVTLLGSGGGERFYEIKWKVYMDCQFGGGFAQAGNVAEHQGLEWDAAFKSGTITSLISWNGNDHVKTGFSGDEGFYVDTPFLDGSTKRLGWGVHNPSNLDRCSSGGGDAVINVSIYGAGPDVPSSGKTIVWKLTAMTEDQGAVCVPSHAYCMFGDFHHTVAKTHFRASGTGFSTVGFEAVQYYIDAANSISNYDSGYMYNHWAYHIPNNGYDCQADPYALFCYDSGYHTGGDFTTGDGPPGDWDDTSVRFGDIEGDNWVSMTHDVFPPGGAWTQSSTKKGYATAEATLKCVVKKAGEPSCFVAFGYIGVADSDPEESRMVYLSIPNDGNWYHCRVDVNHSAGTDFTYGHNEYRWKIATQDRWLAIDYAFLGNKTEYANNMAPGNNMFPVDQCTNIGL